VASNLCYWGAAGVGGLNVLWIHSAFFFFHAANCAELFFARPVFLPKQFDPGTLREPRPSAVFLGFFPGQALAWQSGPAKKGGGGRS